MTDNLDIILPLLNFKSEDDYYFLQIIARKKDKPTFKVSGTNNSARLIRTYNITSRESLVDKYEEIKAVCNLFNARAMIGLNRRSFYASSIEMMVQLSRNIQSTNYNNSRVWNNVSGKYHPIKDKCWIVDIDSPELKYLLVFKRILNNPELLPEGDKIIAEIPSKNGIHLITKPFNTMMFETLRTREFMPKLDIHKNNPTNLYIP